MKMADINRTNSPMNLYREDCLTTKEELDEARERLIKEQSKVAPFLVGSIDRVNERIASLDQELDSFSTNLVIDSRNSNIEDDYAYLTPKYQQLPEKGVGLQEEFPKDAFAKYRPNSSSSSSTKDTKERTQFAGVYAVKSTLIAELGTKTKHLARYEPTNKKATKEKPSTKPKLVELHQYPGYDGNQLTPLPEVDALFILRLVTEAQGDLANKTHYKLEFKRLFHSKMSEAVLVDTFWWYFLQKYHPSKLVQEKIFNRVAHNYVKLTLSAKHPKYRDVFLKSYPDLLSQGIYSAFCAAFPNSWRQFDDKFKSDLCTLTHQWIVGTRPMPNLWKKWNISELEPKDMRKEVLMKKDSKKKGTGGLFNLDFTSVQEPDSTSTSQTGINLKGPKLKSISRTNSNMSTSSMGVTPLDSDINAIAGVAQAQNSSKSTKNPPPAIQAKNASNLHPIDEVNSEPGIPANDSSSASEDSKTAPVKKGEKVENKKKVEDKGKKVERKNGLNGKSRNISNMSIAKSSSMIGSKVKEKKKIESHPAGPGPDFTKVAFNAFGRSPLVQHFLRQKGLERTAGMDVFYQRTEIDKLPPLDAPTYREIIQDSFNSVRHSDNKYQQMHEEGIREHTQFLTQQRQRLKQHMRRENALMGQPREVKRLSDLLVLELLRDQDEVSTGAALAVEEALLQQDSG